jgi:hypothetical protein
LPALVGVDLGAAAEVQLPGVVVAANEVNVFVLQAANHFLGGVEAVDDEEIARLRSVFELIIAAHFLATDGALGKVAQAAVVKVDQADQGDDGKAAAFGLTGGQGKDFAAGGAVGDLHRSAVYGFDRHAAPVIVAAQMAVELLAEGSLDGTKHLHGQVLAGADKTAGGGTGDGPIASAHPLLDPGDGAGAGAVPTENLGEESPEGKVIGIDAPTLGKRLFAIPLFGSV